MSVPKYQELYAPLLKSLKDGQPHHMKEIKESVINQMQLTESDLLEMLPSGSQSKFENRIGWARTYLKKAGLIKSTARSFLVLTEEGEKALPDADVINDRYLKKYASFREFRNLDDGFEQLLF